MPTEEEFEALQEEVHKIKERLSVLPADPRSYVDVLSRLDEMEDSLFGTPSAWTMRTGPMKIEGSPGWKDIWVVEKNYKMGGFLYLPVWYLSYGAKTPSGSGLSLMLSKVEPHGARSDTTFFKTPERGGNMYPVEIERGHWAFILASNSTSDYDLQYLMAHVIFIPNRGLK